MQKKALLLGNTEGFGEAIAKELIIRGWCICAVSRNPVRHFERISHLSKVELVAGDVQDYKFVKNSALGCDLIIHSISYSYKKLVPYMHTATLNLLRAAQFSGATVIFPGTTQVYGNFTEAPVSENSQKYPVNLLGRFHTRLEQTLENAVKDEQVFINKSKLDSLDGELFNPKIKVLILRFGQYFGPGVRNKTHDVIFGEGKQNKSLKVYGCLDVNQDWVYLPDVARVAIDLYELREALEPFEVVNIPGYRVGSRRKFFSYIANIANNSSQVLRSVPWWAVGLAGLFSPTYHEMFCSRKSFENEITLDGAKLKKLLPTFVKTPLDEAISSTLKSYKKE